MDRVGKKLREGHFFLGQMAERAAMKFGEPELLRAPVNSA